MSRRVFDERLLQLYRMCYREAEMSYIAGQRALHKRSLVSQTLSPACLAALDPVQQAQGSGQQHAGMADAFALLPCAVAAAVAGLAASTCGREARCDAADAGPAADAVSVARRQVLRAWSWIEEDLHRDEAALGAKADLPPRRAPEVALEEGRLRVRVPIRKGADLAALLQQLSGWNSTPSGLFNAFSMRVTQVERGSASPEAPDAKVQGVCMSWPLHRGLAARAFIPLSGAEEDAEVEFLKQGALTPEDVTAISHAMRLANAIRRPSSSGQEWQAKGPLDEEVLGAMRDMVRMMQGAGSLLDSLFDQGDLTPLFPSLPGLDEEAQPGGRVIPIEPGVAPLAPPPSKPAPNPQDSQEFDFGGPAANKAVQQLEAKGCIVYRPGKKSEVDWGMLAGYGEQKRAIEDTLLLALLHPEVYNDIARATRRHYASNRPRAVLFEGPPGCGKTTSARVIATQASVPLVYVPLEALGSKWYSESERLLSDVFKASEALDGCIVFLDEIDSLATTRNSEMHEATRRLLGVLLRELDGFDAAKRSVVIGATNRKQDLDPALLSRFDAAIDFPLPDEPCRVEIVRQYAVQLSDAELQALAAATAGMSGRDLRDVAEQAERRWAAKIIHGEVEKGALPPLATYMDAALQRTKERQARHVKRFLNGTVIT